MAVTDTVHAGKRGAGNGIILHNSNGLRSCTTHEEEDRRIKALGQRNGIGHEVTVTFVEPWSLKPRPEPKAKPPPTAPPTDITTQLRVEAKQRQVATVEAVLAVHYRHQMPWDRAWRATQRLTGIRLPDHEAELRRHYENGGFPED
jgi:hypothetical protein